MQKICLTLTYSCVVLRVSGPVLETILFIYVIFLKWLQMGVKEREGGERRGGNEES